MTGAIIVALALIALAAHLMLRAWRRIDAEQERLDRAYVRQLRRAQERSEQ